MNIKGNVGLLGLALVIAANAAWVKAETASSNHVTEDVDQTYKDTQAYVAEKREDYEKRVKAELADLDAKIKEFRGKVSGLGKEGKEKAQIQVRTLKKKRKIAQMKFDRVRAASEKEWEKFKAGVDDAVSDLRNTYIDFKENMK